MLVFVLVCFKLCVFYSFAIILTRKRELVALLWLPSVLRWWFCCCLFFLCTSYCLWMKAARQLNVLQRLSKFLSVEIRLLIFKSFIQSNFNYCPLVWHFCSKANTEKLEKLQYRALRIVFNDYISSYESLLSKVNLPTLHMNRLRCIATEHIGILITCHLNIPEI